MSKEKRITDEKERRFWWRKKREKLPDLFLSFHSLSFLSFILSHLKTATDQNPFFFRHKDRDERKKLKQHKRGCSS